MRTIKFRAWDKDKKEIREVTGINWYDEYIWVDETPMSGDKLSIENTPLMQFTGLLDKNGKEIYEGDIVKVFSPNGELAYNEVIDDIFNAHALSGVGPYGIGSCEVIGNIHENPELINQPK